MARFPQNFIWGAASAAYQIEGGAAEGGRGPSIWDTFSHTPGKVKYGDTGDVAANSYHLWQEDVRAAKQLNLKAYRFSLAWPRILPKGGMSNEEVNAEGLAYYDALIDALLAEGIEPWVTLFHWDLPQALEDRGGWQNPATADAFGFYAKTAAEHFKGRVTHWFTLNEPQCFIGMGYGSGEHAPGLRLPARELFGAWRVMLRAHVLAASALRAADPQNQVGIASTGRIWYPHTDAKEDAAAARQLTFGEDTEAIRRQTAEENAGDFTFRHDLLLDPLCLGRWPAALPPAVRQPAAETPAEELAFYQSGRPDYIGLNIYHGAAARMGQSGPEPVPHPVGGPRTGLFWPVTPQVLGWGPRLIGGRYGLPMVISENGLSWPDRIFRDGGVHDPGRIDFLAAYLEELAAAMAGGADVRGYFHWSLTDNFEWAEGYAPRFGLVYVDYATGRRIPKDSAAWYARLAATGEL